MMHSLFSKVVEDFADKRQNLDYDDAYQYAVAEKHNPIVVSLDRHFDRTESWPGEHRKNS